MAGLVSEVPAEVADRLTGRVGAPGPETMFPLLTVSPELAPQACMLSSAELRWDGRQVRCVLRSRRACRNLSSRPSALLLVVGESHVYHVRLRVAEGPETGGDAAVVCFDIDDVEADGMGVPLRAMTFVRTEELNVKERIADNAALLDRATEPN